MQLHGNVRFRPGCRLESVDPREGELSAPTGVGEHQPVGGHGVSARTGLVTGAVDVAEQLSIELGRPPRRGCIDDGVKQPGILRRDRKSTRLNSSHVAISYAVFCLQKKTK